jgi:hypothetical protein
MAEAGKQCGYIYFLLADKLDAVKIGFTRLSVEGRFKDYSSYCPYAYEVLKVISGTMLEERALHKRFVKDKIRGEWFHYTEELKKFIEELK